ncbi:MAG: NAD(P)-dependent oxidoreductase [Betaproteobacteria bacterium HGW-Betaproteobacteria-5]|jgi:nucleoside-diphosphate-sugar epimerase|nr:MAG: NAD(P)-dependent oxidoreductase [Betaproteobacteria bacterium HGW-Betaproteobacteria-5]PKO30657.1 MAG: NAD(P)-dependent oxidoreductase [Betaproteobacteria bacterium HGW-Betaproteobacteria-7]
MQKVLITGSSGHLGGRAMSLLRTRFEVHAIVRAKPTTRCADVTYHEIDLSRDWSPRLLPERMDTVIHLAQSRNYRDFPASAKETYQVNTGSTALLLNYAQLAGVTRFVLASTGGLYEPSAAVINEKTPVNPPQGELAYYFRTKLAAELLSEPYSTLFDVTVLRPFFIYGLGQSAEKLISRLIASVRHGRPIKLNGEDGLRINPIHIDDAAELLSVLLETNGSRTLNVAGPDTVSIRQIAEITGQFFGVSPVFDCVEGDGVMIVADHRPVSSLLGRPMTAFVDGLRSLIR